MNFSCFCCTAQLWAKHVGARLAICENLLDDAGLRMDFKMLFRLSLNWFHNSPTGCLNARYGGPIYLCALLLLRSCRSTFTGAGVYDLRLILFARVMLLNDTA